MCFAVERAGAFPSSVTSPIVRRLLGYKLFISSPARERSPPTMLQRSDSNGRLRCFRFLSLMQSEQGATSDACCTWLDDGASVQGSGLHGVERHIRWHDLC